jgi:hypothetical protein
VSSDPYIYEKLAQLQDQDRNVSHAQCSQSAEASKTRGFAEFVLSCPLAFQDASSNVEKVKFDAGQLFSVRGTRLTGFISL